MSTFLDQFGTLSSEPLTFFRPLDALPCEPCARYKNYHMGDFILVVVWFEDGKSLTFDFFYLRRRRSFAISPCRVDEDEFRTGRGGSAVLAHHKFVFGAIIPVSKCESAGSHLSDCSRYSVLS